MQFVTAEHLRAIGLRVRCKTIVNISSVLNTIHVRCTVISCVYNVVCVAQCQCILSGYKLRLKYSILMYALQIDKKAFIIK